MNTAVLYRESSPAARRRSTPAGRPQTFSLRSLLKFVGPGFVVAVGYMDPGNWATSLAGGSEFGYALLGVLLLSSFMAMLLQAAAVRLGIATGLDLAQVCRREFSGRTVWFLWVGCEIAIVACNLAEVLGMAWGLNLLFSIPIAAGVCLTAFDVFLVLLLQRRGVRYLEAMIIGMVALIGVCFALQLWWVHPPVEAVLAGFVPTRALWQQPAMLYLAVGIVGATVMPHNLYLHSSIVQARRHDTSEGGLRHTIRYATLDSNIALLLALLINVGIMVLAAGAFHGRASAGGVDIGSAYRLLSPLLGVGAASILFGIGLLASGLSSSVTGTLAGQVVMEGFLHLKMPRATRSLVTRGLALVPALVVAAYFGIAGVGKLLVLSQFVLGIQLPFAMLPLLWFTTRKSYLGRHAFSRATALLLWGTAASILSVNGWVIWTLVTSHHDLLT
jgi:manganese transport protein